MSFEVTAINVAPDADHVRGNIDEPRPGSRVAASLVLEGWALGQTAPVAAVEAVHDGSILAKATLAVRRDDVVAAFPSAPGVETCGFRLRLDLPHVDRAHVHIRLVLADRRTVSLGSMQTRRCPRLDFGDLRRTEPISRDFGFDRGQPIDRFYIERFLARWRDDIRGRVLEVGDDSYTCAFGAGVVQSDILHVSDANPRATIIADLANADHIPSDLFDCVVLTQTLHLLYDVPAALRTLYRILKPGGVLLATVPGISQIARDEWRATWYWSFTELSARRRFAEVFDADDVDVQSWGNVLAATAFLQGLAAEELAEAELAVVDPLYQVLIGIRARKRIEQRGREVRSTTAEAAACVAVKHPRTAILVYHRVADLEVDPWGLAVSPTNFAEQMQVLRENDFHPLPLRALREAGRDIPDRSVVITADDGYADNLHAMRPLLDRFEMPATLFVTSGILQRRREFWWDELERIVLTSAPLPERLQLTIAGRTYVWRVGPEIATRQWRAWNDPPGTRSYLFRSLWELLHPCPEMERQAILSDLRDWSGESPNGRPSHALLDESMLRRLATGRIEIGGHTVTHPSLGSLPMDQQRDEIRTGIETLSGILQRPIRSFAYPFGKPHDFTSTTIDILRGEGIDLACTTNAGVVNRESDYYRLPRLGVPNLGGASFREWLEHALIN